jgi:hypothetical protein
MVTGFRLISQALDIVFSVLKTLEPLVKGLPGDSEVLSGEGDILSGYCIIEDHPFYPQPLNGSNA